MKRIVRRFAVARGRRGGPNAGMGQEHDDYTDNDLPPTRRWAGLFAGLGLIVLGAAVVGWWAVKPRVHSCPFADCATVDPPEPTADDPDP